MTRSIRFYLLLVFFIPCSAYSALLYDENLDGDAGNFSSAPILYLEPGSNTISGSAEFLWTPELNFGDHDGFTVIVPANQYLTSIYITYDTTLIGSEWALEDLDNSSETNTYFNGPGSASHAELFANLNLAHNSSGYQIRMSGAGYTANQLAFINYELDLVVGPTPVPVPAASMLMLTGLLGLFSLGRKRRVESR